jgi:hypothetical protein
MTDADPAGEGAENHESMVDVSHDRTIKLWIAAEEPGFVSGLDFRGCGKTRFLKAAAFRPYEKTRF